MAAPVLRPLIRSAPAARSGSARRALWLAAAPFGLVVGLVILVVLLLAGASQQGCTSSAGLPGDLGGRGSLGGVGGTGLTQAQVRSVRAGSPYAADRVTAGRYLTTAYGPPWGGIQGEGRATSGGLIIGGGAPHWYMVAVDPLFIGHGQLVYIWPNPFGWRGPFVAADTGEAIQGRRIDFYDWRGRTSQLAWARRPARVSSSPIRSAGSDGLVLANAGCSAPVLSRVGERIGRLARAKLGRGPDIPGFEPPAVSYAWCAWFATNVCRKSGVPIPLSAWSGYPYDWARARGQLFKAVGEPPAGETPPVGAALMYGTSSLPPSGSNHINLVDRVLPDGSFMVTGGNQDGSRVTRYGPCRLRRVDPALLSGPGCDPRPIYGIAAPTRESTA
jgi:3D (Asp-Asp-Asp) domain-containing protein